MNDDRGPKSLVVKKVHFLLGKQICQNGLCYTNLWFKNKLTLNKDDLKLQLKLVIPAPGLPILNERRSLGPFSTRSGNDFFQAALLVIHIQAVTQHFPQMEYYLFHYGYYLSAIEWIPELESLSIFLVMYSQVFAAFDKVVHVNSFFVEPFSLTTSTLMVSVMGSTALILYIIFECIER
uniref:Uncharacterized protein n=1 Tax=Romanomermis culicivorax TaxID=13658 RepID=A0A915K5L7_ROMCU